jgi:hypothetical protein
MNHPLGEKQQHGPYKLLNDEPIDSPGEFLGTEHAAEGIASVIMDSMAESPFVLAVDASWGMGKSTLLRQIESQLTHRSDAKNLRFNAWTAKGDNVLEGLIKDVLIELDPNVLRRWIRKLLRQKRIISIALIVSALAARFFGVARLVDELWKRSGGDDKTGNQLRELIHGMLSDWVAKDGKRDPSRALVVFIDDLDRCSDEVVVKVCEAIKLYLDAPGLIFVIACDQSTLARGVASAARGGQGEGRAYLEKIVQVVYRMPPPETEQIRDLILEYATQSGTSALLDESVVEILVEGTGRNPRKIKRIINSYVLEYRLESAWSRPPLGSDQLVRAILLQHLYSPFYDILVNEESGDDPIGEFLDYLEIRDRASDPLDASDPWWDTKNTIFKTHQIHWPPLLKQDQTIVTLLDAVLPECFPELARSKMFVALLRGVDDARTSRALRAQLVRRPLVAYSVSSTDFGNEGWIWQCPTCMRVERSLLRKPRCSGTPEIRHATTYARALPASTDLVPTDNRRVLN